MPLSTIDRGLTGYCDVDAETSLSVSVADGFLVELVTVDGQVVGPVTGINLMQQDPGHAGQVCASHDECDSGKCIAGACSDDWVLRVDVGQGDTRVDRTTGYVWRNDTVFTASGASQVSSTASVIDTPDHLTRVPEGVFRLQRFVRPGEGPLSIEVDVRASRFERVRDHPRAFFATDAVGGSALPLTGDAPVLRVDVSLLLAETYAPAGHPNGRVFRVVASTGMSSVSRDVSLFNECGAFEACIISLGMLDTLDGNVLVELSHGSMENPTLAGILFQVVSGADGDRTDCRGQVGGSATMDRCGVCEGNDECLDCQGVPFGSSEVDVCGVCRGDGLSCIDCHGVPHGQATVDQCGICDGDGTSCIDCNGVPNGSGVLDACDVCDGDGQSCVDCGGVPHGQLVVDVCGECGGDGSSCADCKGVPNGENKLDICMVCGGDGTSCVDCEGVPFGRKRVDSCGVCGGHGETCAKCEACPHPGKCVAGLCASASGRIVINAGGQLVTDQLLSSDTSRGDEEEFVVVGDVFYNTGRVASTDAQIATSQVPGLPSHVFQTERYDPAREPELVYRIPVADGVYDVTLLFAEIYRPNMRVGARVFDVFVNSDLVAEGLDIFERAGGGNIGIGIHVRVRVSEARAVIGGMGGLFVRLRHRVENPKLSGIVIQALDDDGDGGDGGDDDGAGCDGRGADLDECGVCGGDGSSCRDCKHVLGGSAEVDVCGVCGGDGASCVDCRGVPNGRSVLDHCGVCEGSNECGAQDCLGLARHYANDAGFVQIDTARSFVSSARSGGFSRQSTIHGYSGRGYHVYRGREQVTIGSDSRPLSPLGEGKLSYLIDVSDARVVGIDLKWLVQSEAGLEGPAVCANVRVVGADTPQIGGATTQDDHTRRASEPLATWGIGDRLADIPFTTRGDAGIGIICDADDANKGWQWGWAPFGGTDRDYVLYVRTPPQQRYLMLDITTAFVGFAVDRVTVWPALGSHTRLDAIAPITDAGSFSFQRCMDGDGPPGGDGDTNGGGGGGGGSGDGSEGSPTGGPDDGGGGGGDSGGGETDDDVSVRRLCERTCDGVCFGSICTPTSDPVLRINCGSDVDIQLANGDLWYRDAGYNTGSVSRVLTLQIKDAGIRAPIYATGRYDVKDAPSLSYACTLLTLLHGAGEDDDKGGKANSSLSPPLPKRQPEYTMAWLDSLSSSPVSFNV